MTDTVTTPRPIFSIAGEISAKWRNAKGESTVYFGAVPYLNAMRSLVDITDHYGVDPADEVIMYFLSNATTWRGPDARRIKAELKTLAGIK
jgi:hypothetical protein